MTLCDAGPLIALVDQDDKNHSRCALALRSLPPSPLITTWSCWTEAMHLVGKAGGFPARDALWDFYAGGLVKFYLPGEDEWLRMRHLMRQYSDTPMDLGDASLVTAAEELGLRRIFTLDSHFRAYRILGRDTFEIVP